MPPAPAEGVAPGGIPAAPDPRLAEIAAEYAALRALRAAVAAPLLSVFGRWSVRT